MFTAVDYVTGILLNDVVHNLQDVVNQFSLNQNEKGLLTDDLTYIKTFFKSRYDQHANRDDDVDMHGIEYGLNQKCNKTKSNRCNECLFPAWWFSRCHEMVNSHRNNPDRDIDINTIESAVTLLKDAEEKLELYREHRLRVACQQNALKKLAEESELYTRALKLKEPTCAIVIIDWKMKFQSMSARETSQQHFGKRGIGMNVYVLRAFLFVLLYLFFVFGFGFGFHFFVFSFCVHF